MNKWQAQQELWEKLSGLDTYSAFTILPEDTPFPRLTYVPFSGNLGGTTIQTAYLWYRETGWENIAKKADEIAENVAALPPSLELDTGRFKVRLPESNYAIPMNDPDDDLIRRIILSVEVEFLTHI